MKVDAPLYSFDQPEDEVKSLEAKGYAGAFTYEGPHDPFFPLLLASRASESIDLYTAVAIGFARNPMILANIGWDLQATTKGRFMLGLGTQIKPHIEKRFNMSWSKPATRMKEMVLAIKEIWRTWEANERLDFRGELLQQRLVVLDELEQQRVRAAPQRLGRELPIVAHVLEASGSVQRRRARGRARASCNVQSRRAAAGRAARSAGASDGAVESPPTARDVIDQRVGGRERRAGANFA